ncbi:DUF3820 family protein [Balneatrix alpica]|uniref:DUF3820 family protein n=1 Tax=Balneatrix alpica TaxID=75684 RepID=A0ABV5ZBU6_9GAMM|nr:DUF3820 family protein [Balneatrix alpica]
MTHQLDPSTLNQDNLLRLARTPMPYGRFKGRMLINLPEEYLLWFAKQGFPAGQLGELLALCLALKIEGLDALVKPLVASS